MRNTWGDIQDPGGKIQGAHEATLTHHVHSTQIGHNTTPENFNIIGREDHGLARTIKEPIYIRVNNPIHNRNIGKYNLHHFDRVLFHTPDLRAYWACSEFRACA